MKVFIGRLPFFYEHAQRGTKLFNRVACFGADGFFGKSTLTFVPIPVSLSILSLPR